MTRHQDHDPLIADIGQRIEYHTSHYYDGWDGVPEEYKGNGWVLIWHERDYRVNFATYHFQRLVQKPDNGNGADTSPEPSPDGESATPAYIPLSRRIPSPPPDWFIEFQRIAQEREMRDNAAITRLQRQIVDLEEAILNHKIENKRALSIYGSPNALEEVTRMVAVAPQYKDLTTAEHEYVAGVGLASGLNPVFHLHAWVSEDYNKKTRKKERVLHITPDYKALIVSAPDPIMTKERRLTVEEMQARGIPQVEIDRGAIAYVVEGYNLKHAIMARQGGIEYEPKRGYGWWSAVKEKEIWATNENGDRYNTGKTEVAPNDAPTARDGEWVARKRAFRDLFNQIADLRLKFIAPAGGSVRDDEWVMGDAVDEPTPDVIDGEFTVVDNTPAPAKTAWLTEEGETRANAYMLKQGVTDDEINAALGVENWRYSPITADEWKAVVDKIALRHQMETGEIVTVEEAPAAPESTPEPAKNGQEPDAAPDSTEPPAPVVEAAPEPEKPAETAVAVVMCWACHERPANPNNPVDPGICDHCGHKEADKTAAKTGAK